MSPNCQPSKFQQFDGKGNLRQHVAHFMETCNNVGTYGDLMVKQFVRPLKGNALGWYAEPRTIDSIKPKTFEGLTIQAHGRELSMMIAGNLELLVQDPKRVKRSKKLTKGVEPFLAKEKEQFMIITPKVRLAVLLRRTFPSKSTFHQSIAKQTPVE
ncbi:hypothetical protein J1N35_029515 [Gossypium stocksii]|uniref:Retrotransposon gag domain-containing protein n=1 Tax=Gossypium stocksii TaxID=47602 RepID=A0A9D3UY67_9ROSI|nr:hypothetical protein J1N35_029515 [Gossypium stocksii]